MDKESLEVLEKRVSELEKILGIDPNSSTEVAKPKSIPQELKEIDDRLGKYLPESLRRNLNNIIQKYENHSDFLDQMQKDYSIMMTIVEKAKVIMMFEENIEEIYKNLKKVNDLTKYLDFPPIMDVSKKLKELEPIEANFAEQGSQFIEQNENFKALLEVYNQTTRDLNLQFLYLESLLEKIENKK